MKICVSAPDSKIVNLAILKIAAWHLANGDRVKWYEPLFDQDADRLYISKVFTFSPEPIYTPNCEVIKGGTGYDVKSALPKEIDEITDISNAYLQLYADADYSIVFTTRGCVRNCSFCLVREKEGFIHDVEMVSLNPNGRHIKILDNNFFASKTWRSRLETLKSFSQPLDFNQGIDIRAITEEQAEALGNVRIARRIHFAWDNIQDEKSVLNGIERLAKHVPYHQMTCYCLVGYESQGITESDHYRINTLLKLGITPFAMGYIPLDDPTHQKPSDVQKFCRWVNGHVCKIAPFADYDPSIRL